MTKQQVVGSPSIWATRLAKAVGEREQYKSHAEALAEALRELLLKLDTITTDCFAEGADREEREKAREALANWKGAK